MGWKGDHSGYLTTIGGSAVGDIQRSYMAALSSFYLEWMNGRTVFECVDDACNPAFTRTPLPVRTNTSITIDNQTIPLQTSDIYIIGHPGLKVDGLDPIVDQKIKYAQPTSR